jgi:hypothetical protein
MRELWGVDPGDLADDGRFAATDWRATIDDTVYALRDALRPRGFALDGGVLGGGTFSAAVVDGRRREPVALPVRGGTMAALEALDSALARLGAQVVTVGGRNAFLFAVERLDAPLAVGSRVRRRG